MRITKFIDLLIYDFFEILIHSCAFILIFCPLCDPRAADLKLWLHQNAREMTRWYFLFFFASSIAKKHTALCHILYRSIVVKTYTQFLQITKLSTSATIVPSSSVSHNFRIPDPAQLGAVNFYENRNFKRYTWVQL